MSTWTYFNWDLEKKSKTYMNLSPINIEQNTCYGEKCK